MALHIQTVISNKYKNKLHHFLTILTMLVQKHTLQYKVLRQATHLYVQYVTCNQSHKTVDICLYIILYCMCTTAKKKKTNIFSFTKQFSQTYISFFFSFLVKQNRSLNMIHIAIYKNFLELINPHMQIRTKVDSSYTTENCIFHDIDH